jgi:pimeloyl-ACP methyl ester carboxylesterase
MSWMSFTRRLGRDRIAERSPEALVVLLHDLGASAVTLTSIAARWSATVPTTAFIALDGIEQLNVRPCDPPRVAPGANAGTKPTLLDRAAHTLEALLDHQLRSRCLDGTRLVLVGFGYGGTLALHLLLHRSWRCAGILAIAAQLISPLPRILRIDCKVRLIDCMANAQTDHSSLRDDVALLTGRGIDARGIVLSGSPLSDEAVRHGGAYLVELVATAQRGDRFRVERESSHA